jgi:hypothetical protein
MKKNTDGTYTATKFVALTNTTITATGFTREETKANLKAEIKKYRSGASVELSGSINSPGYGVFEDKNGNRNYGRIPGRRGYTWARPDLAKYLREERAKESDEAAQFKTAFDEHKAKQEQEKAE